jgi:clan AA aspartic protease
MIRGRFNENGEPCVQLQIAGLRIEVIVDIGFNGTLWLPTTFLTGLNLEAISTQRFFVADGHPVDAQIFLGKMIWFDKDIEIEIAATESNNALLGTELLRESSLFIHFPTQRVEIRKARKASAKTAIG